MYRDLRAKQSAREPSKCDLHRNKVEGAKRVLHQNAPGEQRRTKNRCYVNPMSMKEKTAVGLGSPERPPRFGLR